MKTFLSNSNRRRWALLGAIALVTGILVAFVSASLFNQGPVETQGHMVVLQSEAAPQLGIVVDKKLRVVDVVEGGAADRAGVKKGDILKKINERQISNAAGARKIFIQLQASESIALSVKRGSKDLSFDITPDVPQVTSGAPTPTAVPPDMMYF
jgi:S1-C subfamily serine protease